MAPYSTVDPACPDGYAIPIEERDAKEVRGYGDLQWAPQSKVFNPSFDVTPAGLVTSLVLDLGVIPSDALVNGGWA